MNGDNLVKSTVVPSVEDLADVKSSTPMLANSGIKDALNTGIVKDSVQSAEDRLSGVGVKGGKGQLLARAVKDITDKAEYDDSGDSGIKSMTRQAAVALQSGINLKGKLAEITVSELDEGEELQGTDKAFRSAQSVAKVNKSAVVKAKQQMVKNGSEKAAKKGTGTKARRLLQSRRNQAMSRKLAEQAAKTAASEGARQSGIRAMLAALSSALAPLAGVMAGIIAFVMCILLIAQIISAIFGFWQNEHNNQTNRVGLPVYITEDMVIASLEMQEQYGHPAGATLAQIICESGVGDHLSGLASQDYNLFGMKWSGVYATAKEVKGKSSWATSEEYAGESVNIIAEFISFHSYRDCITFRSRVFLQAERYANNPLIKEAVQTHSSDKMAEGLKDAGWATSSSYVETLKDIMSTYNLYRFDGITVEEYKISEAYGQAIVKAAYSQLGVPYVWGGTSPGVGLDCSGLTQWCYGQAGKSIPRAGDEQKTKGQVIPLNQARLGDILWTSGHVAIYIGNDQYIHAPQSGEVVKIASGINYFSCAVRY